jgi:hypothetical protein
MSDQDNPATPPTAGPDWDHHEEDVFCPLCEYNLRGLIEPRCPECGYRFEWPDLLDPRRRLHPYLFEHHPEKNFRSFWRTLCGGWRPRRFWSSLQPIQPSRPRRLIAYWFMAAGTIVLTSLAMLVPLTVMQTRACVDGRASATAYYSSPRAMDEDLAAIKKYHGSLEAYLEKCCPTSYFANARITFWSSQFIWPYVLPLIPALAWPWLTLLCLMIFRWSMRRAKVRHLHVLRCVLYSSDILFWYALLLLVMTPLRVQAYLHTLYRYYAGPISASYLDSLPQVETAIGLLAIALAIYRLVVAYRRYLRFDHAIATVLASQIILGLIFLNWVMFPMAWL